MYSRCAVKLPLALFALALAAASAWPRPPIPQAKGYDLRGPALAEGMVLTIKTSTEAKDNEMTLGTGNEATTSKFTTKVTGEQQVELLAVKGRDVTRLRTKIDKLDVASTARGEDETYKAPLSGKVIVSEL